MEPQADTGVLGLNILCHLLAVETLHCLLDLLNVTYLVYKTSSRSVGGVK